MSKERILIVDDEEDILELLRYILTREGYTVKLATTGEEAVKLSAQEKPDLIIMDIILPGMDGLQATRAIKKSPDTSGVPVLMLSAKSEDADIVIGLELGADDYVTKPFSPAVLLARIKTLLRRTGKQEGDQSPIRIGDLTIDVNQREVFVKGRPVKITPGQFRVLQALAQRPGWAFPRGQIVDEIHGWGYDVNDRSIDLHIVALRKKLGPCASYIQTVHGVGYKLSKD